MRRVKVFFSALLVTFCLATLSLFVGVSAVSPLEIVTGSADEQQVLVFLASRIPRTAALLLAGCGMAMTGTILQMLARNRFVEPSTTGTVESAGLGMLMVLVVAPDMPIIAKMFVAAVFALAGTSLFLAILKAMPFRSVLMVPLVGIMLGGMIGAVTTFFAYRFDLLQSMGAWASGDFSTVLRGRYEILWIAFALTVSAYVAADRFTVAGMGEEFSTNLGLNYGQVLSVGLVIVSMVTASVVVTVGVIPFIGLIVPNLVSMAMGDNLRRSLPWIGLCGAFLVLLCDIIGRTVNAPFEIPVGTVLGVIGSLFFLYLLMGKRRRVA
ncbi:iron chelate uptake ABC transporter family permease subunit [Agrobacterium vitis]|nr:ABC transporter permease [Agrobacterium vitis]MVA37116.1 iron chelate uptake ABC transporter family permease subunit [Agrobacterium vitis]